MKCKKCGNDKSKYDCPDEVCHGSSESKLNGLVCVVCRSHIGDEGQSQYAAFGGLPSPCCKVCFEVNDFRIKDMNELAAKSLIRRANNPDFLAAIGIYI